MNGAFGAGIFPVTMALVGEKFDNENRQKALGKVMGLMFLGGATATAMGGILAYLGSWRLVYLIYGIGELLLAIVMLKTLERDQPVVDRLNIVAAYKGALSNSQFMSLVMTIFFVGFSVFGSFITLSGSGNVWLLSLALFGFGLAFIFLQSTLIATVQEKLPTMRGTAMSMASFNMFVGGAIGTTINGVVMKNYGLTRIFANTSFVILLVGLFAAVLISQFQRRKLSSLGN